MWEPPWWVAKKPASIWRVPWPEVRCVSDQMDSTANAAYTRAMRARSAARIVPSSPLSSSNGVTAVWLGASTTRRLPASGARQRGACSELRLGTRSPSPSSRHSSAESESVA